MFNIRAVRLECSPASHCPLFAGTFVRIPFAPLPLSAASIVPFPDAFKYIVWSMFPTYLCHQPNFWRLTNIKWCAMSGCGCNTSYPRLSFNSRIRESIIVCTM